MEEERRIASRMKRERQVRRQKQIIFIMLGVVIATIGIYFVKSRAKEEHQDAAVAASVTATNIDAESVESAEERLKRVKQAAEQAEYPEGVITLLDKNPETVKFVENYGEQKERVPAKEIAELKKGEIPQLLQWDARWGYAPYGTSIVAVCGCGPTCLSMVFSGLTGDKSLTPAKLAEYGTEKGYITEENDTTWAFMSEACREWDISCTESFWDETELERELTAGHPIICSVGPGDFTKEGHFIVLAGYEDGKVIIHDPFSQENSDKKWKYSEFKDQIKSMWTYSKDL